MSTPADPKTHEDPIRSAMSEIISAISALNMHPNPIPLDDQEPDNNGYLSQTDYWAEHAVEHMRAAIECLRIQDNCRSPAVDMLRSLLASGRIGEREACGFVCDLKDGCMTPGDMRQLHIQYLKLKHEMDNDE